MRDEQERALVAAQRRLQLLDGRQVEVVGGFVEHEEIDARGGERRQLGPGALTRREGRRRPQDGVRAEPELGQLRPGPVTGEPGGGHERVREDRRVLQDAPVLSQFADDDARAHVPGPLRQRDPPEQGLHERRLARPVGADERDALRPPDVQGAGPEDEVAPLDHGVGQAHDDGTGPGGLADAEAEIPALPWLLDRLERLERALGAPCPRRQPLGPVDPEVPLRLVVVAGVLLLAGHAGGGPLALALGPPAQRGPLCLVDARRPLPRGRGRPPARPGSRPSRRRRCARCGSARPARGRRSPCGRGRPGRATR